MTVRRPFRPQRKPVFLGCEGRSEEAYGHLISGLVRDEELAIHLDVVTLSPGAGDPLSRVMKTQQRIKHHDRARAAYALKFILMDGDQAADDPRRAARARRLAASHGIEIIWQNPCHEGLLLRHLPRQARRRPTTVADAERALRRNWPDYAKPMGRAKLAVRIGREELEQASGVEPELRQFLQSIGLLPE